MESDAASAHDELVERVADVISMVFEGAGVTETAKGVIALVLEEAADVVGEVGDCAEAGAYITAIRALKEKKNG